MSYLSWSWAWKEVKSRYPDATYEIVKFENGLPYTYDENTGYMVYTKVTIQGITHEMWLPVMDSHNCSMLSKPYEVKTKYNSYTVDKCTMFDVNKTIMRCLTKNLAMFGLTSTVVKTFRKVMMTERNNLLHQHLLLQKTSRKQRT